MTDEDQYFESLQDEKRLIAVELRKLINGASENIVEQIKWNVPTYSVNNSVCSIMAHKHHVNLQFFRGAELKDTNQLQGSGKNMRHLSVSKLAELDKLMVNKLLEQAIAVDAAQ